MTLLTAFADVHAKFPEARLRLAGSGEVDGEPSPYYLELRRYVVESGLDRAVTFLGLLDDTTLREEYAQCALLALSSKVETAPMAITQAMAAGKPVVSTDAGGARHLLENGKTGWIVPVQDSRALSQAMLRILEDEAGALEMGRRAKALAEQRFRASVVAQQTKVVYEIAASHG
jgi:glycosyltransferase involved in cell wall biosynthesis